MALLKENLDKESLKDLEYGIIVSNSNLVSTVIYEAFHCKEFPTTPKGLDILVRDINLICERQFEKVGKNYSSMTFKTLEDLQKWLYKNIYPLESIKLLNISSYEFEIGISCDSITRAKCGDSKQDDFVDLDAFIRNVSHDLLVNRFSINFSSFYNRND